MSLSSTARKVIHDGNASATAFAYTFPILSAAHLSVIYTDASDVETTLSASLYSVTGIGSLTGGTVTYPLSGSPIATGTKLTIVRTVPLTQLTTLSNQGGYYPEVVEQRLDLIYMALQQFDETISRFVAGSISDPATEQTNLTLIQALQTFQTGIDKLTTAGDSLSHNGTSYIRLARGSAGQYLGVSGTALAWLAFPAVSLTTGVSGILPIANGGTGVAAIAGNCLARVSWTGGGTTITSSSNVSSITRTGAGDYTVNVTTALPANATWLYGMNDPTNATIIMFAGGSAPSTTTLRVISATLAGAATDAARYWAAAFG